MERRVVLSRREKHMKNYVAPGTHLLIDFWGTKSMPDEAYIEKALRHAAEACGATVLSVHLHGFGEQAGITGVAVLAESHISIHTWPEIQYMALDVFMCGQCNPRDALPVLREYFEPENERVSEHQRGKPEQPK